MGVTAEDIKAAVESGDIKATDVGRIIESAGYNPSMSPEVVNSKKKMEDANAELLRKNRELEERVGNLSPMAEKYKEISEKDKTFEQKYSEAMKQNEQLTTNYNDIKGKYDSQSGEITQTYDNLITQITEGLTEEQKELIPEQLTGKDKLEWVQKFVTRLGKDSVFKNPGSGVTPTGGAQPDEFKDISEADIALQKKIDPLKSDYEVKFFLKYGTYPEKKEK